MSEIEQLDYEIRKLKGRIETIERELGRVRKIAESADIKATDVEGDLRDLKSS